MTELRASVVMDLRGNLERQARRYEGAMRQMSSAGQRHMGRLQQVTGGLGRTLDRVGNRWVALATGAAGVGVARSLVGLEERWERLGISIGRSREEMEDWRAELRNIARDEGVRIDSDELTSAVELVAQSIQDVDWARESMEGMAVAIAATGESGQVIGQLALEMHRFGVEADDVIRIFDTLERQQDGQRITLAGMAQVLPELLGEYSRYGREGADAVTELGAALTTVVEGGMEPSRARRSIRTVMEVISDPEWQRSARRRGIALEDEAGQTRALTEVMRDLAEFQSRTSFEFGDMGFSEQATRAFNALTSDEGIRNLERLIEIQGDGQQITEKSARSASTAASSLRALREAWREFTDSNLSEPIQAAADALNSLDQETVDLWLKVGGAVAGLTVAAYAGRGVHRLSRQLRGSLGRTTTGGIAGGLGDAVGSMAPIPVYVTNWGPGGAGPGGTGPGGRGGPVPTGTPGNRAGHRVSRPSNWRLAMRAPTLGTLGAGGAGVVGTAGLAVAGAGAAGYGAGTLINDHLISESVGHRIGEAVAQVLATFGNENAQRALEINRAAEAEESTVRIQIDQDGRVREARAEQGRGGPRIDIDTGPWGMWP